MKLVEFVPSVCKGEAPEFEGKITLKRMRFDDRAELMKVIADLAGDETDAAKLAEHQYSVKQQIELTQALIRFSAPFYEKVELVHQKSGDVYTSFEDLTYDPKCDLILTEVVAFLKEGQVEKK